MRALSLLPILALALSAQPGPPRSLHDVAAIATVMVDGDIAKRIETPESQAWAMKKDPKDPWAASDAYDVNHAAFNTTKKTLIRLSKLCPASCDVNLWMPVHGVPDRIQVLIRNVHEMSQFWPWGALNQPVPPEMKKVLTDGSRVVVSKRAGMTSVLAPIHDSLGDIVGLVEVVGMRQPDPQENVK